jgi:hypothetical protein
MIIFPGYRLLASGHFSEVPCLGLSPEYKLNSLFFSFDYLSQSNTFGVVNELAKQPSYSGAVYYYSKYNFDLGVSAIITDNSDSSFTHASLEYEFMAGYAFSVSDNLTIYPSYTHFEYSKNSFTLQSLFTDIIQTDIYLDTKNYFGGVTASYLFGNKNMFFGSVQNALGFDVEDFIFDNSLFSVQLEFDINFSDKNYYNEFIYYDWSQEEFLTWVSEYYPRSETILAGQILVNGLESTKTRFYDILTEYEPELFKPYYTITSVDFMLPIYYSVGSFMFNFTPYIIVPTANTVFYDQNPVFIFNAGIAYNLNF